MSLLSQLSQNLFSNLFGRKKVNDRNVKIQDDTNSLVSNSNSIPSFSVLNRSLSRSSDNDYLPPESTIVKRENIFFGKDIESNDTNEIINYNLQKLRKNSDVITTKIVTSTNSPKTNILDTNKNNISSLNSEKKTDTNLKLDNDVNEKKCLNNLEDKEESDSDTDSDTDSDSNSDAETENDKNSNLSSSLDSNSTKSTSTVHESVISKKENKRSKHSSLDDIILEDLDMDKLIYNVPPPMIKVKNVNPMDSIPIIKYNDSISVPASLTMAKYRDATLNNHSYSSRNILSSSMSYNGNQILPGIRTIELKKPNLNVRPNLNTRLTPPTYNYGKRKLSVPHTPKELAAPLSTSLLALQNEQPSFASLITDDTPSNDLSNESDSFYVYEEDDSDDDYDIFDMKEI